MVVKQEAVLPEPEPAPAPQLILGSQGSSLGKGAPPPPILTDSAGTHLVLTVTCKDADSPGPPNGPSQQVLLLAGGQGLWEGSQPLMTAHLPAGPMLLAILVALFGLPLSPPE